jgi:UDP-N-acetylmuramyl tripeptide synthase
MGQIAAQYSDEVWVTSDNPRSEDPHAIMNEIIQGIPEAHRGKLHREVDRRKAILQAIRQATPHDWVLIAGKGHETYQEIAGQRIAFDDREVAREAFIETRKV